MAELAKISGVSEFWIGLDGRSFWNEENTTMAQKQWMSSGGDIISEIKWKTSIIDSSFVRILLIQYKRKIDGE